MFRKQGIGSKIMTSNRILFNMKEIFLGTCSVVWERAIWKCQWTYIDLLNENTNSIPSCN